LPARPGWSVPHPGAIAVAARSGSRPRPAHRAAPNDHPAPARRAAPESHRGDATHDRELGRARASHHSGDQGRHKSPAARRVPHGVLWPGGPARAPGRARDPHRVRPHPVRDRTVRAGGPPGNSACPRRGPCPVPDQGWPRPARWGVRSRILRLGRRGVRSRGSRWPVHPPVHTRLPSHPGGWGGEVPAPRAHPSGRSRGPPPRAGPGIPGRPASPRGLLAYAGPALSRGVAAFRETAAVGTHAGAGHGGTPGRDRQSHAPAAHAAGPVGPRRSFVPLP
jgi:hypothetical protein